MCRQISWDMRSSKGKAKEFRSSVNVISLRCRCTAHHHLSSSCTHHHHVRMGHHTGHGKMSSEGRCFFLFLFFGAAPTAIRRHRPAIIERASGGKAIGRGEMSPVLRFPLFCFPCIPRACREIAMKRKWDTFQMKKRWYGKLTLRHPHSCVTPFCSLLFVWDQRSARIRNRRKGRSTTFHTRKFVGHQRRWWRHGTHTERRDREGGIFHSGMRWVLF